MIFFAVLLLLTAAVAQEEQPVAIAIIVKAEGSVRYRALDDERSRPARKGQILYPGESIETGDESFCALKFLDDGSLARLISNGEIVVSGSLEKALIRKRLQLIGGSLFCKVVSGNQKFQVEANAALATVKGTEFWIIQEAGTQSLKLLCLEGLVELENDAGKVLVRRGQTGEVQSRKRQAAVRLLRTGELPSEIRKKASVTTLDVGFTNADGERKVLRIQFQE